MDSIPLKSFIQFHGRLLASNPCTDLQFSLRRPRSIGRCVRLIDNKESSLPPPFTVEKRTLATVTGKLLLGLTSALLRIRSSSDEWTVVLPEEEVVCYPDSGKRSVLVAENPVILDQRSEESEQERDSKKVTSPGFSFSAAGLLFPYHLGVARFLLEKGYIKETTPLAGSSAGAVVCAVIASGSSMTDALQATKVLADDCRNKGTAFRLGAVLGNVLREFLPEDVHTRSNGRVRVAITQLSWRPKGLLVDRFDSKEDLINAVLTSSFIPGYSAPRFATLYRNRLCIDGGCTSFMPPTSAAKTVRICAFPAKRFRHIGISPHCSPEGRSSLRQLLDWALEPAEDEVLDKLYELGYLDAQAWAQNNRADSILTNEDFS